MRLFLAIRLSSQMQKALLDCMNDLKKQGMEGRYVPVQNLHLTLAFIGEYDNPKKVKQVIKQVPLDPFPILLSKTGHFGNLLWAGVQENQKLNAYAGQLRQALRQNGIPFDPKKFVPHITLIRNAAAKKPYQVHLAKTEMTVFKASLMKSEFRNGGVVYTEL